MQLTYSDFFSDSKKKHWYDVIRDLKETNDISAKYFLIMFTEAVLFFGWWHGILLMTKWMGAVWEISIAST